MCLHVPGREAVEGRPLVYAVGHHQRPVRGHEGARAVQVAPEVHAGHVVGDRLDILKLAFTFCSVGQCYFVISFAIFYNKIWPLIIVVS